MTNSSYTLPQIRKIITEGGNIALEHISFALKKLDSEEVQEEYDSYDSIEKWNNLKELCEIACSEQANGDADDYHNLAVIFARLNQFKFAVDVLDKGLEVHKFSDDLLADKIMYGIEGGFLRKSGDAYNRIMKLDRSIWKWRAYSFVISYCIEKAKGLPAGEAFTAFRSQAIALANDFIHYAEARSPASMDRAYYKKAEVARFFGCDEKETDILKAGFGAVNLAPQCSLALAEDAFEQGKYDEALPYVKKCIIASKRVQPDINPSYANLLYALIKAQQLLNNVQDRDYSLHQGEIEEIYTFLHIAVDAYDASKSIAKVVEQTIRAMKIQTGIEDTAMAGSNDYI